MSHTARQLLFARRQRAGVHDWANWYDWDDECRYLAGLLIAGGNYDDTGDVE